MKFTGTVKIHNRFDIEIYDAATLRLKETALAENIILDSMWSVLLSGLSSSSPTYFNNIVFGTGMGTLEATRTTLFNRIGSKAPSTYEVIYGFPVSKITRSITINPEEFVGQTFTEVGISNSTTNILTHALIKDSEGNNISLTKTALDLLVIHATVYITLSDKTDRVRFNPDLTNNSLLRHLLYDGTSLNANILTSRSFREHSLSTGSLILAKSATKVDNVAAKSVKYTVRFDVGQSNDEISEVCLSNVYRVRIPEEGIFTGHQLNNVSLGTGDGVNNTFAIPNSRVQNLVVKVDGVETSDYTLSYNLNQFLLDRTSYSPKSSALNRAYSIEYLKDIDVLAVIELTALNLYQCSADTDVMPLILSVELGRTPSNMSVTPDGKYVCLAYTSAPYLEVYNINYTTLEATLCNIDTSHLTSLSATQVALSSDGTLLVLPRSSTPYMNVYQRTGLTYTLLSNAIDTSDNRSRYGVYINKACTKLYVGQAYTPFIRQYTIGKDMFDTYTFTELAAPSVPLTSSNSVYKLLMNSTEDRLLAAVSTSPYLCIFTVSGDDVTLLSRPSNITTTTAQNVDLVQDNLYIQSRNITSAPHRYLYELFPDGTAVSLPVLDNSAYALSATGSDRMLFMSSNSNIAKYVWEYTKPIITFNSPVPADTVVTADYFVPYIPKTTDYVLDVEMELVFQEEV
jgi:hypothetical protein